MKTAAHIFQDRKSCLLAGCPSFAFMTGLLQYKLQWLWEFHGEVLEIKATGLDKSSLCNLSGCSCAVPLDPCRAGGFLSFGVR